MSRREDALRAQMQVYWVSDGVGADPARWIQRAESAFAAGVGCLQLRDKFASDAVLIERARAIRPLCERYGVRLVINDRLEVALAAGAHGVHLGQSDMDPVRARARLPAGMFIGWSIETLEQAARAREMPVDYLAVSPLFDTPTKTDTAPAFGLEGLRAVRHLTDRPLIAIGGIDVDNVAAVIAAGADGVAVVRAIEDVPDPAFAAAALRGAFAAAGRTARPARVLTIAGSDSGGGAGIQADLKTFAALGCYGMSAITAVTAQNTLGVQAIFALPPELLGQQIESVLDDLGADAIKIGMLHDPSIVDVVARALERHPDIPVVLDPVMVATSGDRLIREETIDSIVERLFPRACLVTPNLDELKLLAGREISDEHSATQAAHELIEKGARAVLIKGGHLPGNTLIDRLIDPQGEGLRIVAERIPTVNLHGTGCSLSSAIAAHLALGETLVDAAREGVRYVREGVRSARWLQFGAGHGPLDHAHAPVRLTRFVAPAAD
ncbi:MAG: Phosphomethylpyrimidine kinase (HMP-phosphate kinase) kinase [Pseudomonadota bacterium]|jgi:hydroxymethylpyrimidine kinase/phosphomethylpyrimidine kinase/thiamine-phosphate diphosphorylase